MADQPVPAGGIPAGQPHPDGVHGAADAERGRHGCSLLHRPPLDHRRPGGHPPPRPEQRAARPGGGEQGRPDPPLGRVPVLEERSDVEQGPAHRAHPDQLPAAAQPGMPERGVLVAGQQLQTRAHASKGRPGGQPGREGTRRADQGVGGPLDPDPHGPAHEGGEPSGHALMDRGPGHQRVPERIEQGRGLDRRRRRGGDGVEPAKDVHRRRRGPSHDMSLRPRPRRFPSDLVAPSSRVAARATSPRRDECDRSRGSRRQTVHVGGWRAAGNAPGCACGWLLAQRRRERSREPSAISGSAGQACRGAGAAPARPGAAHQQSPQGPM